MHTGSLPSTFVQLFIAADCENKNGNQEIVSSFYEQDKNRQDQCAHSCRRSGTYGRFGSAGFSAASTLVVTSPPPVVVALLDSISLTFQLVEDDDVVVEEVNSVELTALPLRPMLGLLGASFSDSPGTDNLLTIKTERNNFNKG